MAHLSEHSITLERVRWNIGSPSELAAAQALNDHTWFFVLPFAPTGNSTEVPLVWQNAFVDFAKTAAESATIAILTTPDAAARLYLAMEEHVHFKLWIAVKVACGLPVSGELTRQHAALLILTRYKTSLLHTKTRIAYTYCPFCEKTTKDYGGKKHTYHEYGTLMSDIWRDICPDPRGAFPEEIADRLSDLFGLEPFRKLYCVDLRNALAMRQTGEPARPVGDREPISRGVTDEPFILRQGDSLQLLKDIETESIDFCFADPPYNLKKKYENWHDTLELQAYFEWCDNWLSELARVVKAGCTVAVLNIPLWAIRHFAHLQKILRFQYWIAWEGLSLPVRMIMPAHYAIVCFSKGEARTPPGLLWDRLPPSEKEELLSLKESYCLREPCVQSRRLREDDRTAITDLWWDIHRLKHNCHRVDHPCQLPPSLMRRLIALFTSPNERVLDPFNGVGTTTLAAEQLGRRFIGIELSEYYHKIAEKRHADLRSGEDPFRKTRVTPKAKNSPVARLKKQTYAVPKKVLQLDVKRIAGQLGRLPSRAEVERLSRYPITYFEEYFISWGEVCAAARTTGMIETKQGRRRSPPAQQLTLFSNE
jgi:DNA modification methylase